MEQILLEHLSSLLAVGVTLVAAYLKRLLDLKKMRRRQFDKDNQIRILNDTIGILNKRN